MNQRDREDMYAGLIVIVALVILGVTIYYSAHHSGACHTRWEYARSQADTISAFKQGCLIP